jgi:putative flippase GtrA
LNKIFNFKNKSKKIAQQFGLFAIVALIGLGLNQLIIWLLVEFGNLWYMSAKLISIVIVMLWSFYGHKKLTFGMIK